MIANLSTPDRFARLLISLLLGWFWIMQDNYIYGWLALFFYIEFFFSWCVIYALMGHSTCPVQDPTKPWYKRTGWPTWVFGIPGWILIIFICLILVFYGNW